MHHYSSPICEHYLGDGKNGPIPPSKASPAQPGPALFIPKLNPKN